MAFNIKRRRGRAVDSRIGRPDRETLTAAVTTALRERLERVNASGPDADATRRTEGLLALGGDIASRLTEPWASRDHGDLLYDDAGLLR